MNKQFKVGDIVGDFRLGGGVGEVIEVFEDGKVLVTFHAWSEPDAVFECEELDANPYD
jgi:hypothetical protein